MVEFDVVTIYYHLSVNITAFNFCFVTEFCPFSLTFSVLSNISAKYYQNQFIYVQVKQAKGQTIFETAYISKPTTIWHKLKQMELNLACLTL